MDDWLDRLSVAESFRLMWRTEGGRPRGRQARGPRDPPPRPLPTTWACVQPQGKAVGDATTLDGGPTLRLLHAHLRVCMCKADRAALRPARFQTPVVQAYVIAAS